MSHSFFCHKKNIPSAPATSQSSSSSFTPAPKGSGKGGNPTMTRRNSAVAAFKKTLVVGGRKMTADEVRMVWQQSDEDFEALTREQQEIHINKYKDEVKDRQKQGSSPSATSVSTLRLAEEKKYTPQLNCNGCLSLPIKPCQFKKYFEDAGGWPTDDEIYKDESWIVTEDDASKVVLRGLQIAINLALNENREIND